MVTTTREEALRTLFSDRRLTLSTLLEIEDKSRKLVPLHLNPIQDDMVRNSGPRDIYVKPGQVGATSLFIGDFYLDNITVSGTVSVIISYDEFSAKRQILKAKKYHRSLEKRIPTIPKLEHKAAEELSWENTKTKFHSSMYIFSARSFALGRGETIHNLLLDEFAFWPLGTHEEVFASAVQRVPLLAGTKVRIVSTPNGEDNPFCEMYRAAKEGKEVGGSVYTPHFYPWYIHPEYIMLPEDPFALPGDEQEPLPNLAPDELQLLRKLSTVYSFSPLEAMGKLRWRRYKKAEMKSLHRSGVTLLIFEQEYPEDDETCFITAGGQAYDSELVTEKVRGCYPAVAHRTVVHPKGMSAAVGIWVQPDPNRGYVIGIDPGKGKVSESVASVWTFSEGYRTIGNKNEPPRDIPPVLQHCATLAGYYDEDEMAEYCKQLGYLYNGAVLAPEDNLDIVSHLKDYPDLYWREDVRTGKLGRAIGWQSNVSTKPYMITEVSRNLEYLDCKDIRFWSQCKNIRRSGESRSGIVVVGADDHHDAGAIAIVCRTSQPVQRGYVGSAGWGDDWGR